MEISGQNYILDDVTQKYIEQLCGHTDMDYNNTIIKAFNCWMAANGITDVIFEWIGGTIYDYYVFVDAYINKKIKSQTFNDASDAAEFHNYIEREFNKDFERLREYAEWRYLSIDDLLTELRNEFAPKNIDRWMNNNRFTPADKLRIIQQLEQRYKIETAKGSQLDTAGGDVLQYCSLMREQLASAASGNTPLGIPVEQMQTIFGGVWDEWHTINEQTASNGVCGSQYNPFARVLKDEFINAATSYDLGKYVISKDGRGGNKTALMFTVMVIYKRLQCIDKEAALRWADETAKRVDDGKCYADGCAKKRRNNVTACKYFEMLFTDN